MSGACVLLTAADSNLIRRRVPISGKTSDPQKPLKIPICGEQFLVKSKVQDSSHFRLHVATMGTSLADLLMI
jgi:hypothetical protein